MDKQQKNIFWVYISIKQQARITSKHFHQATSQVHHLCIIYLFLHNIDTYILTFFGHKSANLNNFNFLCFLFINNTFYISCRHKIKLSCLWLKNTEILIKKLKNGISHHTLTKISLIQYNRPIRRISISHGPLQ